MSALIVTVLKLLGSIVSGGLLFQAFVANNHGRPITRLAGIIVSVITLFMFIVDIRTLIPDTSSEVTERIYWQSVERHPSVKAYKHYLMTYPNGKFAAIAQLDIANYANADSTGATQNPNFLAKQTKVVDEQVIDIESLYWTTARQHSSDVLYRMYLEKYPNGRFSVLARAQLAPSKLSKKSMAVTQTQAMQSSKITRTWQTLGHYQVSSDLVKDTDTGLMWVRCSAGQLWQDLGCHGDAVGYTWQQAIDYAKNIDVAGYSDWRLPSRNELKTLVLCSSAKIETLKVGRSLCAGNYIKPTIDNRVFPKTPKVWFWTSIPDNDDKRIAWGVNFNDGYDGWDFGYSVNRVRLVRKSTTALH